MEFQKWICVFGSINKINTMIYLVVIMSYFATCSAVVNTVPNLNLNQYAGTWYQVYTDLTVIRSIQHNAMCVVTNYVVRNNQTMMVNESYRQWDPHGPLVEMEGKIIQPNLALPGNLEMKYNEMPYVTPYLVINLGPIDERKNQYQYAIVTDMNRASLYIYARCVHDFHRRYKDEVLKFCQDNGFTSYYNVPKETPQPPSCHYPPF